MPPKGSGRSKKAAGAKVLANNHVVETEKPSDTDVKDSISTVTSIQTENGGKVTRKGKQVKPVAKKPHGDGLQIADIEIDEADVPLKTEIQKHKEEEIVKENLENNSKVTKPAPKRGNKKTGVKTKEQDVIPENSEDDNGVQKEEVEEDYDLPNKNLKRQGTKIEVTDTYPEETFIVPKKSKKEKNQAVKEPKPEEIIPVSNVEGLNSTFIIDNKPKEKTDSDSEPPTKFDTKPMEASTSGKIVKGNRKAAKLTTDSPRVTRSRGAGTALKRPLPTQKAEPIKSIKRKATADTKLKKANTQSDKNVVHESSELSGQDLQPTVAIKRNENLDQKALEAVKGDSKTKGKPAKNEVPQKKVSKKEQDVTDLDFSNNSKTTEGELWNFKIASWNINGIRAWLEKGCMSYLLHEKPDILCVQETKCSLEKIPEDDQLKGYHTYWLAGDKEGYSGVGIISKQEPLSIKYGIDIEEHDTEGRVITAEYEKFYLVAAYVPNAGRGLVRLDYRTKWDKDFLEFLKNLDQKKPVILCGDLNVAHEEIDLANPKSNKKNAGFTKEEREGFGTLLAADFVDTFRHLYPEQKGAYTFWTYMMNARAKNVGWRLDYFIISKRFTKHLCDSVIRKEVLGSDHCPINLFLRF